MDSAEHQTEPSFKMLCFVNETSPEILFPFFNKRNYRTKTTDFRKLLPSKFLNMLNLTKINGFTCYVELVVFIGILDENLLNENLCELHIPANFQTLDHMERVQTMVVFTVMLIVHCNLEGTKV